MYAEYFGLKQEPFSIAPDPHYLFMSERHREALAHLLYGIRGGGGFVLLSGEIGAGKTTICRCFLEQMPEHCRVAYIFNPKLTVSDLLKTICHEFQIPVQHTGIGPPTIKDHLDPLNEYLLASHAKGQQNILIIDEAQNLTPHVLEQLRLLTNLETSERKLLQVILIGQPELRQMVARPELEQLAQRVIARFHLGALTEGETSQYIQHRMGIGGLRGPMPFSAGALQRIHAITRGVPRRINLLCDRSLLGAYANGLPRVDEAVVNKAAAEVFETAESAPAVAPTRALQWTAGAKNLLLGALGGGLAAAALFWLWPGSPVPPATTTAPTSASEVAPSPTAAPSATTPTPHSPSAGAAPTQSDASSTGLAAAAPAEAPAPSSSLPSASALLTSESAGLRELGALWNRPLVGANPCASALRLDLQCFRTNRMTLHGLGQMDRPAVLTLHLPGQDNRWALLTAITPDTATLRAGSETWLLPLSVLADIWRGDYTTLWQLPPGHEGELRQGNTGAAGAWLRQQLDRLATRQPTIASANNLTSQIEAFQRSQGLETDGLAGPMTFMQLNRVSGVNEPRLRSPST
ncbi:AAA family ATPase [Hydrogenophaga sp.]|uniref:ExeA family protein n=1 Tax=Hydrogenophaga sp. TaxID=1904254 RepID=UPI00271E9E81|nr:AAA family ATPase [Hydrogenophaga sp.]MDO8905863.1 AAA family ATPase [Hydrogenophaga sp.]